MAFERYTPPATYTPPARDPRDSDYAHSAYAAMHKIATEFQAAKLDAVDGRVVALDWSAKSGVLVDANTARLVVQIADNLNDENRAKFLAMDVPQMGIIAWKLV